MVIASFEPILDQCSISIPSKTPELLYFMTFSWGIMMKHSSETVIT